MYLDDLSPAACHTGYGELGTQGQLGYENGSVAVHNQTYAHALSAHAPSSLVYLLDGNYDYFSCQAAINDTAHGRATETSFRVIGDGKVIASARNVTAGCAKTIQVCIRGVRRLELVVEPTEMASCHAVWLNPQVSTWDSDGLLDCLGQVRIHPPQLPIEADTCFVTMVSPGYERWLDIFLNSLERNGNCPDAKVIVYCVDGDESCSEVIRKHQAIEVRCQALVPKSAAIKPAIYSIGCIARVNKVVCLEADMIVLGDLSALFAGSDSLEPQGILVAKEMPWDCQSKLVDFFSSIYQGTEGELEATFRATPTEREFGMQINSGLLAGTSEAMIALDNTIRDMCPEAFYWLRVRPDLPYRDQFVTNMALARLDTAVPLNLTYNTQLCRRDFPLFRDETGIWGEYKQQRVKIFHFNGARHKHIDLQSYYLERENPDKKLINGLAQLGKATREELQDEEYLSGLIRQIGLEPHPYCDCTWFYGDDVAYMNATAGIYQIPIQLAKALIFLSDKGIRSYAEIGVFHGWTFAFITAYLNRFNTLERAVAVDVEFSFSALQRVRDLFPIEYIQGTAASLKGQTFDLVFVDAEHTYEASKSDYNKIGCSAAWCMFHDINDSLLEDYWKQNCVPVLWSELKQQHPHHVEFLQHSQDTRVMGIGILQQPRE